MCNPSRRKRTPRSGEAKQKNLFRTKRRSDQDRRPERRTRARDLSAVDDAQQRLKLFLRPQRKLRRLSSCPRYLQQPSIRVVGREKRMPIRRLFAQKKVESGRRKAPGRTQFMLAWRTSLTPLEYALAQKWGRGGCILLRWFWASNLERGFRYEILPFSLRGAPTAGKKLDEWPGAWIPLSIRGSCAERPSCRVAEGFGPDDATTTGSALFAGRQVPIPARFAGDMKLGSEFSPHSPLPGMRHFFWHAGPGVARRPL